MEFTTNAQSPLSADLDACTQLIDDLKATVERTIDRMQESLVAAHEQHEQWAQKVLCDLRALQYQAPPVSSHYVELALVVLGVFLLGAVVGYWWLGA